LPDRKKRTMDAEDNRQHDTAKAIASARPLTSRGNSRSPSTASGRRSSSNSEAHARLRSQSLRMEPLQLSQVPCPSSQSPINTDQSLAGGQRAAGFDPQLLPTVSSDHEGHRAHPHEPASFHAPQPVHSRWVIPNTTQPYELHAEGPGRLEDVRGTDSMHGNMVSPHHLAFNTQYTGSEFHRESPIDRYFPSVASSGRPPSANHQVAPSPFQDMFQTADMGDGQRYTEPVSSTRTLWNPYAQNDPFANYTTVSITSTTPPVSDHVSHTSNMLPPMMIPSDGFTRPTSHRLSSIAEPPSGFSALNSYFGNTSGTSTAYLSGNLHRHNGS